MREQIYRNVNQIKQDYPKGTRILLIQMNDEPRPIGPNTCGTVYHVDDLGTIHCHFDNGRSLGVLMGKDEFRKLTREEIEKEMNLKTDEE